VRGIISNVGRQEGHFLAWGCWFLLETVSMVTFYEDDISPFLPKLFVKFFGKESCRVGALTLVWEIFP
jgi:hypothetical protein